MKKFHFFLFLSAVFFIISCGDRKTENQTGLRDDPKDEDIYADYDPTSDDDISADNDSAPDDDISSNHDPAPDNDIVTDTDSTADGDIETNDDAVTDSDSTDDISSTDADDIEDSDETADDDDPKCDLENGVTFTKQPEKMSVVLDNRSVFLSCELEAEGCGITYQWYESQDEPEDPGTAIPDAVETTFETPVFTEKGIRYYYCAATAVSPSGESRTYISDIASVAYTAIPILYVNTPDSVEIISKEEWIEDADISLVGAADESWNFENIETSIRGRGNSTWSRPKKPYALKLKTAREIMGMPEHKRWVLLANYFDNSFMRNEAAFYLSELFELGWTVHGEFVDLVLNGKYNGLYWLGEAIKVDKNRVDIDDGNPEMTDDEDKDYLVEMNIYFDETLKFKSEIRDLPYMIQNEDYMVDENDVITAGGQARLERFQAKINELEKLLYPDFTEGMDTNDCSAPDESYSEIIDIDSWIKFWFVNEIMDNWDAGHPRSDFFTFDSTNNIFKAGPVWDFDLAASRRPSTCQLNKTIYYNALFKSPKFITRTKELWNEYSARIDIDPQIETMKNRIFIAAEYDAMLWGRHDYINGTLNNDDLKIFYDYAEYLKESVRQKISVVNSYIENLSESEANP